MTRSHTILAALAIGGAGVYSACSKTPPEPERTNEAPLRGTVPTSSVVPSAGNSSSPAGLDDIGWEAPSSWQSVPNANAMRMATYKIPRTSGDTEDAELTVSHAGGGVDANINRWAKQFGSAEPKTERRSPNGLKVTVVEITGTYASGGMMGGPATPKENFMLLGAVVDGGERQHFFKMTGPKKTVTAAKKDFDALVASFRAK